MPDFSTPEVQPAPLTSSVVYPIRRFLLFQLDFSADVLNGELSPRWQASDGKPTQPVAVSDIGDYDAPKTDTYWRNNLRLDKANPPFSKRAESHFKQFTADIFNAFNAGTLGLRQDNKGNPYLDISNYVRTSTSFSVSAKDVDNKLTLMMGRQDSVNDQQTVAGTQLNDRVLNPFDGILPRENDVIMVVTQYPGEVGFKMEYLGFVNTVKLAGSYGSLDTYEIDVAGLSKIAKDTEVVKQRSLDAPVLYLPGVEISNSEQVSFYDDNYNALDIRRIFEKFLNTVFSFTTDEKSTGQQAWLPEYTRGYYPDPTQFVPGVVKNPTAVAGDDLMVSDTKTAFQHNFFTLMTLFLMTTTKALENDPLFPKRAEANPNSSTYYDKVWGLRDAAGAGSGSEFYQETPKDDTQVILSPFGRAFLDHGEHAAYNVMTAKGHEAFYPNMMKPSQLLDDIRNTAFYDAFESRDGVMVCRPARYNRIEKTIDEGRRFNVDTWARKTGSTKYDPSVVFIWDPATSTWEFNPNGDFYIKNEQLLNLPERVFDSEALESRTDIKFMMQYHGAHSKNIPSGAYSDLDVLLRFGMKTKGPITNPNALNMTAPKLFAPLANALVNAPSRPAMLTVKDDRKFYIGKLYYIQALDCVGYLIHDDIIHLHSGLSAHQLQFTMVRRVVRRPISAILEADAIGQKHELLNVGMCYLSDPPGSEQTILEYASSAGLDSSMGPWLNKREVLIQSAKVFLETTMLHPPLEEGESVPVTSQMQNPSAHPNFTQGSGARMVMFRYIPSILDVILEMEADPRGSDVDDNETASKNKAAKDKAGKLVSPLLNDCLTYVERFHVETHKQPYDIKGGYSTTIKNMNNASQFGTLQAVFPNRDGIVLPPAGAVNYAPYIPGSPSYQQTNPNDDLVYYEGGTPEPFDNVLEFIQTPFEAAALCSNKSNLTFSQLLVNKLAGVDLSMKYYPSQDQPGDALHPNYNGIPQLYSWNGASFDLFMPGVNPRLFFNWVDDTKQGSFTMGDPGTNAGLASLPCCLRWYYHPLPGASSPQDMISNSAYQIPGDAGVFNVPYGHFMVLNKPAVGGIPLLPNARWVRVQSTINGIYGGSVKITRGPSGSITVAPNDAHTKLVEEDGGFNGAGTPLPILNVAEAYLGILYFFTPFAEPTIERLLNFPLPPYIGGQPLQSDVNNIKQLIQAGAVSVDTANNLLKPVPVDSNGAPRLLNMNNPQPEGDGVMFSLDYLAAQSGSDLSVVPRSKTDTGSDIPFGETYQVQSVWYKFENAFKTPDSDLDKSAFSGLRRHTKDRYEAKYMSSALLAKYSYPDGTPAKPRLCSAYLFQIVASRPDPDLPKAIEKEFSQANLTDDVAYAQVQIKRGEAPVLKLLPSTNTSSPK